MDCPAIDRLTPHFLGYMPFIVAMSIVLQVFLRASTFTYPITNTTTGEIVGEAGMPSFVYYIVVTQILLFSSFTVVQLVVTLRPPRDYYWGELSYMILSLTAKGILSFLLLSNVIAIGVFT